MNVHVFVGPTLTRAEVSQELPRAEVFGPVGFGDVYRSVGAGAHCIAIIDGYFERIPPVWHKEILYALTEGVHVFGASSMGALRAAELDAFGMRGIGVIYDAYRSGALEDDDEVTIVHGSAGEGYAPVSEAMVNIRITLLAAAQAGVIENSTAQLVIDLAKQRFYAERSCAAAINDAKSRGGPADELAALHAWLPAGGVDQKAADARALLQHLRQWLASAPGPLRSTFRLERTDAWLEAQRAADAEGEAHASSGASLPLQRHLEEELKLAGDYGAAFDRAAVRAAALADARRAGFRPDARAAGHAAELVRRELGLIDKSEFEAWCGAQGLGRDDLVRLFEEQARVVWARPKLEPGAREQLVSGLRVSGQYRVLAEKVAAKAQLLEGFGPRGPSLADLRMTELEVWQWFFETIGGGDVPTDLQQFARQSGFDDADEMRGAVVRELYFRRMTDGAGSRVQRSTAAQAGP